MNFHERPDEAIIVMNVYLPAGSRTYLGVFVFGVFLSLICVIWLSALLSLHRTHDAQGFGIRNAKNFDPDQDG